MDDPNYLSCVRLALGPCVAKQLSLSQTEQAPDRAFESLHGWTNRDNAVIPTPQVA